MLYGARNKRRGAATSELVVSALVVLILYVAASPFCRMARSEAAVHRCFATRSMIAEAVSQYWRQHGKAPAHLTDLGALVPAHARCPKHGSYDWIVSNGRLLDFNGEPIPAGCVVVRCDTDGHGANAPGMDVTSFNRPAKSASVN